MHRLEELSRRYLNNILLPHLLLHLMHFFFCFHYVNSTQIVWIVPLLLCYRTITKRKQSRKEILLSSILLLAFFQKSPMKVELHRSSSILHHLLPQLKNYQYIHLLLVLAQELSLFPLQLHRNKQLCGLNYQLLHHPSKFSLLLHQINFLPLF